MGRLRLSYSSLQFFFESGCFYAWKLREEMRPKEINEFAAQGILVHQIMAGDRELVEGDTSATKLFVKKLWETFQATGMEMKRREFWISANVLPGIEYVGKVDFDAVTVDNKYVIGDWKTTGKVWDGLETAPGAQIWPQGSTFQPVSYLLPDFWPKKPPRACFFVVAGFRGPGTVLTYTRNKKLEENFFEALNIVKRQRVFPKVPGKHCLTCDFKKACWKLPNWQEAYETRANELRKRG
jgi:hypothetical protein